MTPGFLITSAINTKFGVFDSTQRFNQTLNTIESVKTRCPNAKIVLIEMAGLPLTTEQQNILMTVTDKIISFTNDPTVKEIYKSSNWDVVKSATEMLCFGHVLNMIAEQPSYAKVDRIFKLSGRYALTEDFDFSYYEHPSILDKIVIGNHRKSQFTPEITGNCTLQYMSRCWSFPSLYITQMATTYEQMLVFMLDRVKNGGYVDIEHCLYKFLPSTLVVEKSVIGVQGVLGPNGALVKD